MITLDQLKQRLTQDFEETRSRIEQSEIFQKLQVQWDNLEPKYQRIAKIAAPVLVVLILVLPSLTSWQSASEEIETFENKKELIRTLMLAQKDLADLPSLPNPMTLDSIKNKIQNEILNDGLLPEQTQPIQNFNLDAKQIGPFASIVEGLLKIELKQITIKQLVQMTSRIESISPQVKLKNFVISQDTKQAGYLNASLDLLVYKYNEIKLELPVDPPTKKSRGRK